MIEYRSFRNYDPPHVHRLWHQAGLGPGAALHSSNDCSFDLMNYAQHYFDPDGLILAVDDGDPCGFVHAGFACGDDGRWISSSTGVVCSVVVHPEYRRQGIGRELVRRAEQYLRQRGVTEIYAGGGRQRDPFYSGVYGGASLSGFRLSDASSGPFFEALGYQRREEYLSMSRPMDSRDPVSFRLTMLRRKWELALVDRPDPCSWWWMSHYGRMDALFCVLIPTGGGRHVASVTVVGLDNYVQSWNQHAIGLIDLWVEPSRRNQGFGQALLVEVIRRLRQESITMVTANIPADDEGAVAVFRSAGMEERDRGIVYAAPAVASSPVSV